MTVEGKQCPFDESAAYKGGVWFIIRGFLHM